ncbi:MAG: fasciclin domain-containing protein [Dyadobacter sp.]|uniref:fasciclin domain-containing protein n=1 Tax=Dyadobacter sp. TaxID=1914288 RepID=UPI001B273DC7|nr:fasciclin domain-containing protein [Dyadobacter sp.]MBO9615324.1 fasciclin domain-containing protein [Dyadobacter sp.]
MKKNRFGGRWATFFLAAGLFSTILISCKEDKGDLVGQRTVTDIIHENPEFSILKEILDNGGSPDAFRTQDATFFLPDNAAFQKANIASSAAISKNAALPFLNSLIIQGIYNVDNDLPADSLKTAAVGKKIKFVKQDKVVTVNNSEITKRNVVAANGLIQVIDSVYVRVK